LAGDEDGTLAGWVLGAFLVPGIHSIVSSPVLEDLGGIVLADTAEVGGLAGVAEDPLGSTDGVLGGTTGDVLDW